MIKFSNENIPVEENEGAVQGLKIAYRDGEKVPCRDPFIMPYNGRYYLYKTNGEQGIVCLISDDLKTWSEPIEVYRTPENFHGYDCWFWAPECHYYKGYFYIFTSVKSKKYNDRRCISAYRAKSPLGPFEDIADGCISPKAWDAIDGTLYVDQTGQPWLVFVHEWTSMPDQNGSMVAAKLSEDFTCLISEPIHLFYARDPEWQTCGVTDGPFLYRTDGGTLFMLWSNFSKKGYVVALASSKNGEIDGEWQQEGLLYQKGMREEFVYDGGHAMIFKKKDGGLAIAFHSPNNKKQTGVDETVTVLDIVERNRRIELL